MNIEKVLTSLADMEFITQGDKLSSVVNSVLGTEIFEEELELVSAAGNSDYSNFKMFLEKKNIG